MHKPVSDKHAVCDFFEFFDGRLQCPAKPPWLSQDRHRQFPSRRVNAPAAIGTHWGLHPYKPSETLREVAALIDRSSFVDALAGAG